MPDSSIDELLSVILRLIQSHDFLNVPLSKYVYILFRSESGSLAWLSTIKGSHERSKLARDDPVNVTILNSLIKLIVFHIKCLQIVPIELDAPLESIEAVKDGAMIPTVTLGSISERSNLIMIGSESFPCFFRSLLQDDDHEGAHQEQGV